MGERLAPISFLKDSAGTNKKFSRNTLLLYRDEVEWFHCMKD